MDVSALVQQMHDNLSAIHTTISTISTDKHGTELEELEQKRDALLDSFRADFDKEKEELHDKRQAELDEIQEKRRKEDEEREARRRLEDEEIQSKNTTEDVERQGKLEGEIKQLDDETDQKLDEVEAAAKAVIEECNNRLQALQEKRRVRITSSILPREPLGLNIVHRKSIA